MVNIDKKSKNKEIGYIATSFLVSISTIIKLICNFVLSKIFAIFLGPGGFAIIGQFQNISSMLQTFSTGCISNGIIKYTSQYKNHNLNKLKHLLSTSLIITVICSLIISGILFLFAEKFALYVLQSDKYTNIFRIFGFTLIFYALNTFFMSILNGYNELKKYITINIVSSIVSLIFVVFLSIKYGIYGALVAYVTFQSIIIIVTINFVLKCDWFNLSNFLLGIDKESLINLSKFALMAIIAFTIMPLSQIFIRNYVITHDSLTSAGILQGIWKISETYLLVLTTTNSVYYIPKLSAIRSKKDLKNEIISAYKIIIPISLILACFVYLFKTQLIKLFFSDDFLSMTPLFFPQLFGDIIKMAARVLFLVTVARAMTFWSIFSENSIQILFTLLAIPLINKFGIIGVTYSYIISNIFFLIMMIILLRKIFFKNSFLNKSRNIYNNVKNG